MTSLGAQEVENRGAKPREKKERLSLRIHELAQDCQNLNGLRHGDYEQYRQYCTRRLKKLRSSRDVRLMFGKGKTFVKKVHPETCRVLGCPLALAQPLSQLLPFKFTTNDIPTPWSPTTLFNHEHGD